MGSRQENGPDYGVIGNKGMPQKSKWGLSYAHKADAFATTPWWVQEAHEAMEPLLNSHTYSGESPMVLDFACNTGRFVELAKQVFPYAKFVGIDINAEAVKIAKERLPEETWLTYLLPAYKDTFDHVVIIHALPQIEDVPGTLAKIWSSMKRGGTISVVTHNKYYDWVRRPMNWLKGYKGDPTINHHYTLGELKQVMWDAGFECIELKRMGDGWPGILRNRMVFHGRKPL